MPTRSTSSRQASVSRLDFNLADDVQALVLLLDQYARDPAGLGHGLPQAVLQRLPGVLRGSSHYRGWIARIDGEPAGLINTFEAVSTFRAEPNMNIHDIIVAERFRRMGVARSLLAAVEHEARAIGCCKLTLEVLDGNTPAFEAYLQAGFESYSLDPSLGRAVFLQKKFYND